MLARPDQPCQTAHLTRPIFGTSFVRFLPGPQLYLSRRIFVSRATSSAAQYFIRFFSIAILLLAAHVTCAQNTISTVAGGPPPNNVAPTAAPIEGPVAIARDASGNLYVVNDI